MVTLRVSSTIFFEAGPGGIRFALLVLTPFAVKTEWCCLITWVGFKQKICGQYFKRSNIVNYDGKLTTTHA